MQAKTECTRKKSWTVQYNGPFLLESQRVSPAQMFHNEQPSSDDVKHVVKDMRQQLQYIDTQLDKMQESMKELQVVPETAPKGKSITGNHILAQKQLWVNDTYLAPMVQIANDRDTTHTSSKLPPHLTPNRLKPKDSNGQVDISHDPSCNDYWTPDINQVYMETGEAFDHTSADALHCRQLQDK